MRRVSIHKVQRACRAVYRSLRVRLFVLSALVILPLIAERLNAVHVGRNDQIRMAELQALDLARQGSDAQDDLLSSSRAIVSTIALTRSAKTPAGQRCSELVSGIAEHTPWLPQIVVTDLSGSIRCSNRPELLAANISDRQFFKRAIATKSVVVSEYLFGRVSNMPFLAVAAPVLDENGEPVAVVSATLDLTWISRLIQALSERSHASAFLVDSSGTLIARYPVVGTAREQDYSSYSLISTILGSGIGTLRAKGLDGRPKIFGYVKLKQADAWLAVGIAEADIMADLNSETDLLYAMLIGLAALIMAAVWWGGERLIIRPVRQFVNKSLELGDGRYSCETADEPLPTEFVPLSSALDQMAGRLAARELELNARNRQLDRLARTDSLTGLENRRSLDARLFALWRSNCGKSTPLSFLMIDVDHFKEFNDRHGHLEGDRCLQAVGEIVQQAALAAESSCAARYGGEEFAVIAAGLSAPEALKLAETIRQQVSEQTASTVSIGVAQMRVAETADPLTLVEEADMALYEAKSNGRNRVCAANAMNWLRVVNC